MVFISLLILAATSIASSAAFFSVYGLANTFSGTFYAVVAMGASLEAGKLMSASYLYRYWNKTHIILRSVLLAVIFAVMLLTSGGIFAFLSSGYQADVLPLKQKADQVKLLTDERARDLARKAQIDDLMANATTVNTIQSKDGSVSHYASRVLQEATRSRDRLYNQYKTEQKHVTDRIAEIDKELLPLQQDLIKTEAHVGPIIYIAKAFGLDSDNATKYLIYLIIFAFDPMAIALTLAVNVALRIRKEEQDAAKRLYATPTPTPTPTPPPPPPEPEKVPEPAIVPVEEPVVVPEPQPPVAVEEPVSRISIPTSPDHTPSTFVMSPSGHLVNPSRSVRPPPPATVSPIVDLPLNSRPGSAWSNTAGTIDAAKINELVTHYRQLKTKKSTTPLTRDELADFNAIADVLQKHGFSMYL